MAEIYIAFADTPGLFAGIIRRVIKQDYVHVLMAFDERLEDAYSIGRRNPAIPFFAGFERENREKILKKFPGARYMVCKVSCTPKQRRYLEDVMHQAYRSRFRYHYTVLGLPFLLANRPFYQKNHYTCSSWMAKVMEDAGICTWGKHFSLVTPKDFYEYEDKQVLFEGPLSVFAGGGKEEKGRAHRPACKAAYEC